MTVRRPTNSDAAAICALYDRELGFPYQLEEASEQLAALLTDPNHGIWVAEKASSVVGVVEARDFRAVYLPYLVDVVGIAVSSSHRRAGVGRALMAAVTNWASRRGAEGVRLVSGSARKEAHPFYESLGFVRVKEQTNYRLKL